MKQSLARLSKRVRHWCWRAEGRNKTVVSHKVPPIPRPAELARFEGMWVAVIDGHVQVAEHTSQRLALKLHEMDHRKRRRAVIEFVRPSSSSYIVGVG